jgi:DNA mismatch endonuclease (patch repair protein)
VIRGRKTEDGRQKKLFSVRPDFVFQKLKAAVFVDGCFWHGCPRHFIQPKGNAKFWRDKISTNRARDRMVNRTLRSMGWKVVRVWEHELRHRDEAKLLRRLAVVGGTKPGRA